MAQMPWQITVHSGGKKKSLCDAISYRHHRHRVQHTGGIPAGLTPCSALHFNPPDDDDGGGGGGGAGS